MGRGTATAAVSVLALALALLGTGMPAVQALERDWLLRLTAPELQGAVPRALAADPATGTVAVAALRPAPGGGGAGAPGAALVLLLCDDAGAVLATGEWCAPDLVLESLAGAGFLADGSGAVFVAGTARAVDGTGVAVLLLFDAAAQLEWALPSVPPAGGDAAAIGAVCDPAGATLYAGVLLRTPKGAFELRLLACERASGRLLAQGRQALRKGYPDALAAIAWDAAAGQPLLAGAVGGGKRGAALTAVRFRADGRAAWRQRTKLKSASVLTLARLRPDSARNRLYLAGADSARAVAGAGSGPSFLAAIDLRAKRNPLWIRFLPALAGAAEAKPEDLLLDPAGGDAFVLRTRAGAAGANELWLTRLDAAGAVQWNTCVSDGAAKSLVPAAAAFVPGAGPAFTGVVTGHEQASAGLLLAACDPAWGAWHWLHPPGAGTARRAGGSALAADSAGRLLVAGTEEGVPWACRWSGSGTADADGDGLADAWEWFHFGHLRAGFADDPDGDLLANGQEQAAGTSPLCADSDGDGLPDGWECFAGTDPLCPDADADPDGDGVTSGEEFLVGRDPRRGAIDDDGAGKVGLSLWTPLE